MKCGAFLGVPLWCGATFAAGSLVGIVGGDTACAVASPEVEHDSVAKEYLPAGIAVAAYRGSGTDIGDN